MCLALIPTTYLKPKNETKPVETTVTKNETGIEKQGVSENTEKTVLTEKDKIIVKTEEQITVIKEEKEIVEPEITETKKENLVKKEG